MASASTPKNKPSTGSADSSTKSGVDKTGSPKEVQAKNEAIEEDDETREEEAKKEKKKKKEKEKEINEKQQRLSPLYGQPLPCKIGLQIPGFKESIVAKSGFIRQIRTPQTTPVTTSTLKTPPVTKSMKEHFGHELELVPISSSGRIEPKITLVSKSLLRALGIKLAPGQRDGPVKWLPYPKVEKLENFKNEPAGTFVPRKVTIVGTINLNFKVVNDDQKKCFTTKKPQLVHIVEEEDLPFEVALAHGLPAAEIAKPGWIASPSESEQIQTKEVPSVEFLLTLAEEFKSLLAANH